MEWINDDLRQSAVRARTSLAMLLYGPNRTILATLPVMPADALDCYIFRVIERVALVHLGCGFGALQAAAKLEVLQGMSYAAMRHCAEFSREFAQVEQERLALVRMP